MTGPPAKFQIRESREGGTVRLRLVGELDLASAPKLEQRLDALRASGQAVRLDLSTLEFIDSSGIQVLFEAFRRARGDRWPFEIAPEVSPQIASVFEIVNLGQLLSRPDSSNTGDTPPNT